jgi:uncharacterized protein YdeI (YjbR/CyaY-like superfamily)
MVVDPTRTHAFASAAELEHWLRQNHEREPELWLKLHKKTSGLPTVSPTEAVQVALCWGWIDGIRKSFDEQSFLQRFTPRRQKSIWSQINREHVARLISEGRMQPAGMAHIDAAKANGRWQAAYPPSSTLVLPADLLSAIEADSKALATFERLNKQNRFALAFRLNNLRTVAGRSRKIESFVQMLARGETIHPSPDRTGASGTAPATTRKKKKKALRASTEKPTTSRARPSTTAKASKRSRRPSSSTR